jgi:tetratricopeptide (TPR) repeat protein
MGGVKRKTAAALICLSCVATFAYAQPPRSASDRQLADVHYREGWRLLAAESYQEAAKEFQQAIDLNPQFPLAYYGLGRSHMGLKKFGEAINAYEKTRDFYRTRAGDNFANRMDVNAIRDQDIAGLQMAIQQFSPRANGNNQAAQNQLQQMRTQMQRLRMRRDNGMDLSLDSVVPAFVSLALGSAYFRSDRIADAEREYKAAIDADPKAGEAHNNLAVVYMTTDRADDAEREVKAAEKLGYNVNPNLKDDIKKKKAGV